MIQDENINRTFFLRPEIKFRYRKKYFFLNIFLRIYFYQGRLKTLMNGYKFLVYLELRKTDSFLRFCVTPELTDHLIHTFLHRRSFDFRVLHPVSLRIYSWIHFADCAGFIGIRENFPCLISLAATRKAFVERGMWSFRGILAHASWKNDFRG